MTAKSSYIYPVLCFGTFVYWLIAVAMDGPIPAEAGLSGSSEAFLLVHAASLFFIGIFCPEKIFRRLVPAGCIVTAGLTMLIPFADPPTGFWIMGTMGISGAFVAIGACMVLTCSPAPLLCAAAGLSAANLLLFPLTKFPAPILVHSGAVALALALIPAAAAGLPAAETEGKKIAGTWHYLPFILVFKIVCGLMYSFITPAYNETAVIPGFEMIFYVLAVFAGYLVIRINRDLALICGVVFGMTAFTILQAGSGMHSVNSAMFVLQGATGFVDIVLISVILDLPDRVRGFGIGLATICTGIIAGGLIGRHFAGMIDAIVLAGHFALNLSVLTLYLLGRYGYIPRRSHTAPVPAGTDRQDILQNISGQNETIPSRDRGQLPGFVPKPGSDEVSAEMPRYLRLLLSERECLVLRKVMAGRTYRQTAAELDISESTVKTYMHRIYEKMGVSGKKNLFEKLNSL
ncbi:MAG: helix-turn-helix domain-containing protein [Desulfosalsimonas sp.]